LKFEQGRKNWKRTAVVKSARAQALSHVVAREEQFFKRKEEGISCPLERHKES